MKWIYTILIKKACNVIVLMSIQVRRMLKQRCVLVCWHEKLLWTSGWRWKNVVYFLTRDFVLKVMSVRWMLKLGPEFTVLSGNYQDVFCTFFTLPWARRIIIFFIVCLWDLDLIERKNFFVCRPYLLLLSISFTTFSEKTEIYKHLCRLT